MSRESEIALKVYVNNQFLGEVPLMNLDLQQLFPNDTIPGADRTDNDGHKSIPLSVNLTGDPAVLRAALFDPKKTVELSFGRQSLLTTVYTYDKPVSLCDPKSAIVTYVFDRMGNLVSSDPEPPVDPPTIVG